MMTKLQISLALLWAFTLSVKAANLVPLPSEVQSYERVQPIFLSKELSREKCDALLKLLDGGLAIQAWHPYPSNTPPDQIGEIVLPPPGLTLKLTLTNGSNLEISFSSGGGLVYLPLPDHICETREEGVRKQIERILNDLNEDLKREISSQPKPFVYRVGTINDGSTLSGLARIFYGDAGKWRVIYEANRDKIKDPNMIDGRMKLLIPSLKK